MESIEAQYALVSASQRLCHIAAVDAWQACAFRQVLLVKFLVI